MDIVTSPAISILDQVKVQAQILVPLLKALRGELGEEQTNKLVTAVLRESSRDMILRNGARIPGSPRQKWEALVSENSPRISNDIDIELLKLEPDALEFNVTGCRYADFFRALGETELGSVLLCENDYVTVEVGSPEVELKRTQTIMEGAKYCDFRYRMKISGNSK